MTQPRRPRPELFVNLGVALLITAFFAFTSSYTATPAQLAAAFVLCLVPWSACRKWLLGKREGIPFFALLSGVIWLAYAVPLFWAKHDVTGVFGRRPLSETSITQSLWLAVLGVICFWAGMRVAGRFRGLPKIRSDVSDNPHRWNYLRLIFVVGALVKTFVPITAFGMGGRQIVSNFENTVPVVAFAVFVRYYLRGKLVQVDKVLLMGFVLIALVVGMSSGWLGSFVSVGIVCAVVYIYERRKLPVLAVFTVLPFVLFFQPAKSAFRARYWKGQSNDSLTERVDFWVNNSWKLWSDALTQGDRDKTRDLANATLNRFSLLEQTANIIELTPSRVPYQYGSLYSYIGVTFVPRFLWPDKPSVNDANRWYQVTYGLTLRGQLSNVSIAVGTVAESYINFGWFGPLLIIFPLGIFLGSFERIFLQAESGLLFSSLGAVLVPQLMTVEAMMAEYVAGLAQQIFLVIVVLLPTLESRARRTALRPATLSPRSSTSGTLPVFRQQPQRE